MIKLIKLTRLWNIGLLKKKYIERIIYVNPQSVDYVWDFTKNDNSLVQAVLHINGKRIYIKENFNDVMKMLKGDTK
jgi:hypothetical protein